MTSGFCSARPLSSSAAGVVGQISCAEVGRNSVLSRGACEYPVDHRDRVNAPVVSEIGRTTFQIVLQQWLIQLPSCEDWSRNNPLPVQGEKQCYRGLLSVLTRV